MKHYCIRVEHNAIAAAAISSGLQSRPSFSQRFTQQHLRLQTVNSRRSSGSLPPLSLPMFSFHRAKNQYCLPCPCSACAAPCSICFSLILRSPEKMHNGAGTRLSRGDSCGTALGWQPLSKVHLKFVISAKDPFKHHVIICSANFTTTRRPLFTIFTVLSRNFVWLQSEHLTAHLKNTSVLNCCKTGPCVSHCEKLSMFAALVVRERRFQMKTREEIKFFVTFLGIVEVTADWMKVYRFLCYIYSATHASCAACRLQDLVQN